MDAGTAHSGIEVERGRAADAGTVGASREFGAGVSVARPHCAGLRQWPDQYSGGRAAAGDQADGGKVAQSFCEQRLDGLLDEPRCGAPRTVGDAEIEKVIVRMLESKPKEATHWSTRSMAQESGLSHMTIRRMWNAFGLEPHRSETFKLSTDPQFVEKVRDIRRVISEPAGPGGGAVRG